MEVERSAVSGLAARLEYAGKRREVTATDGGRTDLYVPRTGVTGRSGRDDDAGTALRRGK
jgi:hypothetical protein